MPRIVSGARSVAEALLVLLKARGVDWIFAVPGTDFAPVLEAVAVSRASEAGLNIPQVVGVAHETAAVAMAHGAFLATGRPQAVIAHTNVGTANCSMGLLNACRDAIPIILLAGHTPITESGHFAGRDLPIHWGQDMFDQPGMVRSFVKWDYVLRFGDQIENVVDRGLSIAMTEPYGPIYIGLPREPLAEPLTEFSFNDPPEMSAAQAASPACDAIHEAATLLARASRPLIVTSRTGRDVQSASSLALLAEQFAIPVVQFWPTTNSLASTHEMNVGFDPGQLVPQADAILVLDCLVPWIPRHGPAPDCPVIQIGPDPLFGDIPLRSFPSRLSIASSVATALKSLHAALDKQAVTESRIRKRRQRVAQLRTDRRDHLQSALQTMTGHGHKLSAHWVSHCLNSLIDEATVVVNELGCNPELLDLPRAGSYHSFSPAGGLGWGVPAALGMQLAMPDRTIIATVGDGSHLFANPVACHHLAQKFGLPILVLIFNNRCWNSVAAATTGLYPDGTAARPIFLTGKKYLNHLNSLNVWNKSEAINPKIIAALKGMTKGSFWVIEVSLPELFPANRAKLGEVVLNASREKSPPGLQVEFARLPGFLYVMQGNKEAGTMVAAYPTGVNTHSQIYLCDQDGR